MSYTSDTPWVSNVLNDPRLVFGTSIDRSEPAWTAIIDGRIPSDDELPIRLYSNEEGQRFDRVPELFEGEGGTKLLPKLAAIFEQFDLGGAALMPAQLYRFDRKTEIDLEIRLLVQLKRLDLIVLEQCRFKPPHRSRHRPKDAPPPPIRFLPRDLEDDEITVLLSSELPSDLWHDNRVHMSLFFSDQLKTALSDAGYARLFDFRRCRVIKPN